MFGVLTTFIGFLCIFGSISWLLDLSITFAVVSACICTVLMVAILYLVIKYREEDE